MIAGLSLDIALILLLFNAINGKKEGVTIVHLKEIIPCLLLIDLIGILI